MEKKYRLVSPVLMWLIVIAGIIFSVLLLPSQRIIPENMFTPFLFLLMLLYWIYAFISAAKIHKQAPVSTAAIKKLVTTGIYSKVRHPIYSADILLSWGIFLFLPTKRVLASVIWLTLILSIWIFLEEKSLTKKFGSEYLNYKKKVPRVIPKVH